MVTVAVITIIAIVAVVAIVAAVVTIVTVIAVITAVVAVVAVAVAAIVAATMAVIAVVAAVAPVVAGVVIAIPVPVSVLVNTAGAQGSKLRDVEAFVGADALGLEQVRLTAAADAAAVDVAEVGQVIDGLADLDTGLWYVTPVEDEVSVGWDGEVGQEADSNRGEEHVPRRTDYWCPAKDMMKDSN